MQGDGDKLHAGTPAKVLKFPAGAPGGKGKGGGEGGGVGGQREEVAGWGGGGA